MAGKVVTKDYEKPTWSSLPFYENFALEVIKNGVVIDEIPLKDKEYFILGRQPDIVDIQLDHESISRKHAVLNFRNDGYLMLKDFGSAQGTWINKQICEKDKFYQLNVGDVIKFGCSTRIYVLKGPENFVPEEVETEELRNLREQAIERAKQKKSQMPKADDGISWGMSFDEPEQDGDERSPKNSKGNEDEEDNERFRNPSRFSQDLKRSFLPEYLRKDENYDRKYGDKFSVELDEGDFHNEKDKQILEKIRTKESKIQHMQEETKRIYLKESKQEDGLTQGQLNAIERNDKAIEQLKEEIEQLIESIRQKNHMRELTSDNYRKKTKRTDDDEDDDFDAEGNVMDTSKQTSDVSTNWRLKKKLQKISHVMAAPGQSSVSTTSTSSTLDYQQIKKEMDEVQERKKSIQERLQKLIALQEKNKRSSGEAEGAEDEVDLVIKQDIHHELQQKIKHLQSEESEVNLKVKNLEKLLAVVTPALRSLVQKPPQTTSQIAITLAQSEERKQLDSELMNASKPVKMAVADDGEEDQRFKSFLEFQKEMEKEKELENQQTSPSQPTANIEFKLPPPSKQPIVKGPTVKGPTRPDPSMMQQSPSNNPSSVYPSAPIIDSKKQLQDGDFIWVPPKQQKGDGKTSLNDKFGY